jgi:hypothetical protein
MKISEMVAIAAVIILLGVALLGGLGYANYCIDKSACDQLGRRTKNMTIYEYPSGCFVVIEGRWVPAAHWRINLEKSNGQ